LHPPNPRFTQGTVNDLRASLAHQLAETAATVLAIEIGDHGQFIGYSGLIVSRATWEETELAFELFRSYHGRGYATEAGSRSRCDQLRTRASVVNGPSLERFRSSTN
jgi:RimJ/RimL family protein N-acetyltransferase